MGREPSIGRRAPPTRPNMGRVSDEIPFVRKEFSDQVARTIYPAMKRAGLRRQGKRLWYEQRPDSSWVMIEIQVSDHTTRTKLEFTVHTAVWPPGIWAHTQRSHQVWAAAPMPSPYHGSAISARPAQVRPDLWPESDFIEVRLGEEVAVAVEKLLVFLLAALEWGRAHTDVETALEFLTRPFDMRTHRHVPRYESAIAMLRATRPGDPRLLELEETLAQGGRNM